VPERGREGRHRRQRREAGRGVQGAVKTDLLIGNEWRSAPKRYCLTNPATEEPLAEVADAGEAEIDAAVQAARACLDSKEWRELPARKRGQLLYRIAELLEQRAPEIAEVETKNNGKPLFESKIDVAMAIETFRYYAGWADKLTGDTLPVSGNFFAYTLREPVGVVGAIVPWNFPLNLASWKVAPALAAGCTVVLKPAHETPLTALLLGEIAVAAGLPPGALNVVPGPGATAGAALVRHPLVDKIAFTGSTEVGQWIMREAAAKVKGKGYYVEATVFDGAKPGMKIVDEEIFGPVLSVLTFAGEAEGIQLANRSMYGLAAGIWTKDIQKAHRVARAIKAGTVWIN